MDAQYPPQPPPAAGPAHRSAPFSCHSRGVQMLDTNRLIDVPYQAKSAFRHLRDISASAFVFLQIQSWVSVYVVILTICSCAFFTYYENTKVAAPLDWTLVCFVVILPLLGLVWWGYQRREQALRDLAEVKSLLLHIFLAHRDWVPSGNTPPGHEVEVQQQLFSLIDGMRAYFLPPRFYARHYPFTLVKEKMMRIAQDRAKQVRRISASFKKLSRASEVLRTAGLPDAQAARLAEFNFRLQAAFERMANIKEYRTPQGVRSMARFFVVIFIPLFFGPYYAYINVYGFHGFAMEVFFASLLHLAMVGLLNVSMALEDPFDNHGLDGIYVDEALFEAEQAIGMDEEAESYASHEHVIAGMPMPPAAGTMVMATDKQPGQMKDVTAAPAEVHAQSEDVPPATSAISLG